MNQQLNELSKDELIGLVDAMAWNEGFGCYTRAGFERLIWPEIASRAKWIIYLDIDGMGELNASHGHEGVNAMIKQGLGVRASDFVAGQWFSGDEFIICITQAPGREAADPAALCERLAEGFRAIGFSATFGIAPVISPVLLDNVEPADRLVQAAKNAGRRGTINQVK